MSVGTREQRAGVRVCLLSVSRVPRESPKKPSGYFHHFSCFMHFSFFFCHVYALLINFIIRSSFSYLYDTAKSLEPFKHLPGEGVFLLFLISRNVICATCPCSEIKKKNTHLILIYVLAFEWPLSPCERARNFLLETFACVAGIRLCIYSKCCLFKYPRVHSLQSFHLARPEPMPVVRACGLNCLVIFRPPTSFIFYISRCSCLFDVLIMFWQATLQSPARYCFF